MNDTPEEVVVPWVENPYKPLSWWDMEKFSAQAFSPSESF